eukprot:TRINITY_DN12480_c6_g1_i1.p1 TRINITY_DN12480_c6_g1~~TRINITY_DN12480_c6_g1_i1.p1  ORF type:complete len:435 (+),score=30.31 TRINITY_DN12480_c6_g1_i1:72-1307(+)
MLDDGRFRVRFPGQSSRWRRWHTSFLVDYLSKKHPRDITLELCTVESAADLHFVTRFLIEHTKEIHFRRLFLIPVQDVTATQAWLEADPQRRISVDWSFDLIEMDPGVFPFKVSSATFSNYNGTINQIKWCVQSLQWPVDTLEFGRPLGLDQNNWADIVPYQLPDFSAVVGPQTTVTTRLPIKIETDQLQTLRFDRMYRGIGLTLDHSTIDTRCERLELECLPSDADLEACVPKLQALIERTQCRTLEIDLAALPFLSDPLPRIKVVTLHVPYEQLPLDEIIKALQTARIRFPNACSIQPKYVESSTATKHFALFRYYSAGAPAEAIGRSMVLHARNWGVAKSDATYLYQDVAFKAPASRRDEHPTMLQLLGDFAMATSIYDRDRALTPLDIPDTMWSALFRAMYLTGYSK